MVHFYYKHPTRIALQFVSYLQITIATNEKITEEILWSMVKIWHNGSFSIHDDYYYYSYWRTKFCTYSQNHWSDFSACLFLNFSEFMRMQTWVVFKRDEYKRCMICLAWIRYNAFALQPYHARVSLRSVSVFEESFFA